MSFVEVILVLAIMLGFYYIAYQDGRKAQYINDLENWMIKKK